MEECTTVMFYSLLSAFHSGTTSDAETSGERREENTESAEESLCKERAVCVCVKALKQ